MIKANEFRIGNYCMDEKSGAWLIVDEIKSTDDGHVLGFYVVDRSKYPLQPSWQAAPIPLTPELLERAGFEKEKNFLLEPVASRFTLPILINGKQFDDREISFTCKNVNGKEVFGEYECCGIYASERILYLHQLQNLYFALTSTELEIREPVK